MGHLGFPRVQIQEAAQPNNYAVRVYVTTGNLVDELPEAKELLSRLQDDVRIRALEGKMLSSGSGAKRFEIRDLVEWWLWRANDVGRALANENLRSFLDLETVPAREVLWLYGVKVDLPLQVLPDVTLVPIGDMPPSDDKERFLRQAFGFFSWPSPQSALVRNIAVPKIASEDLVFSGDSVLSDVALLLNALPDSWCSPAFHTSYGHPDLPLGPFFGSGGGSPLFDVVPRRTCSINGPIFENFGTLFSAFNKLKGSKRTRITRSLLRMSNAKGRIDDRESWLDLGICLEMILLNPEHKGQELPGQLSLHFKLRGSWLLGENYEDRLEIYNSLGEIYKFRSQIAHNGFSDALDKLGYDQRRDKLSRHLRIAEKLLVKLIVDGSPDNWPSIFLSGPKT